MSEPLSALLARVRACTLCADHLPDGPRPVVQTSATARIVVIGQAPGRRVHASGVPWDDPSGDRLRDWMGLTSERFYDPSTVALIPMGLCYPGSGAGGDLPPRPECAPTWHDLLLAHLPSDRLTVVLGAHAIDRYVPERAGTLADTVARWREFLPDRIVLPHPSPRNNRWLQTRPWVEEEVIPALRARVAELVD